VQLQASRKIKVSATALRTHALVQLQKLAKAIRPGNARLGLIMLALKGNKIGFEKMIKMIDDLVATLKTEQKDHDDKKEYCSAQFDASDLKKKELVTGKPPEGKGKPPVKKSLKK
jgi:hypothetical protein